MLARRTPKRPCSLRPVSYVMAQSLDVSRHFWNGLLPMIPTNNTIPYESTPRATYSIIALCTLAFIYQITLSGTAAERFVLDYALVPARYTVGGWANANGLSRFDPLPFLTSMFLHGGLFHILSNMWTLWVFGPALEDRLGTARFALLYASAGLAAGATHLLFNLTSSIPTLGASGAIAGVVAAYATRFPYAWLNVLQPIGLLPVFFYMPAIVFAGLWFTAQVISAIGALIMPAGVSGVAWWAHIGGFLVGWLLLPPIAPDAHPLREQDAALRSALWPWLAWSRWFFWWGKR